MNRLMIIHGSSAKRVNIGCFDGFQYRTIEENPTHQKGILRSPIFRLYVIFFSTHLQIRIETFVHAVHARKYTDCADEEQDLGVGSLYKFKTSLNLLTIITKPTSTILTDEFLEKEHPNLFYAYCIIIYIFCVN